MQHVLVVSMSEELSPITAGLCNMLVRVMEVIISGSHADGQCVHDRGEHNQVI